jgi:hypothetical protein
MSSPTKREVPLDPRVIDQGQRKLIAFYKKQQVDKNKRHEDLH